MKDFTLIFDGGYDRNGGYGSYIIFRGDKLVAFEHRRQYPETKTSNQAEYQSLILALASLENLAEKGDEVEIFGDSQLVVQQLRGTYRVRNKNLKPLFNRCREILIKFDWFIQWWPREQSMQFFEH